MKVSQKSLKKDQNQTAHIANKIYFDYNSIDQSESEKAIAGIELIMDIHFNGLSKASLIEIFLKY